MQAKIPRSTGTTQRGNNIGGPCKLPSPLPKSRKKSSAKVFPEQQFSLRCHSSRSSQPSGAVNDALRVPVRGAFARPRKVPSFESSRPDVTGNSGLYGYAPRYEVTPKILNAIVQVEKFRGFLQGAKLSPQWVKNARDRAFFSEAHHTTHIEGTGLSSAQSEYLLSGFDIPQANPDDVREVLNYRRAFDLVINQLGKGAPITEIMIREIHRRLVEGVRGDRAVPGEYRTVQNYVANSQTGEIIYRPPAAFEIPRLMDELIQWLRLKTDVSPVIKSGVAQFQLVHIHPFLDGNGRTARLLSALVLYKKGYGLKQLFTISALYDKDRAAYYRAIQSVREQDMDLTSWLEYFSTGLAGQMQEVQKRAELALRAEAIAIKYSLNKRQESAMEGLLDKKLLTLDDLVFLHPEVTRSTLQRDLAQICSAELVEKQRTGVGRLYVLKDRLTVSLL